MSYVLSNEPWSNWTLDRVGGKAAALTTLVQSGIEVPKFAAVTVEAYSRFVSQEGNCQTLMGALRRISAQPAPQELEDISSHIRASFELSAIPEEVEEQIAKAYDEYLNACSVAVRSSATSEDLPEASFAGQHESFLRISGVASLLEHVKKCWSSLWSSRAIAYRMKMGVRHESVLMAVVVQRMVDSDLSGVLFTQNPLGPAGEMMVSAVPGFGDLLVSGHTNPREWVISTKGSIFDATEKFAGASRSEAQLSKEQFQLLGSTGKRIEAVFGRPQDIEWTFSNEKLFVLQSRPVRTPARSEFQISRGFWTRIGLGEWLQKPMSPLFATFLMPVFSSHTDRLFERSLALTRPSPTWTSLNGYYYIRANVHFRMRLLHAPFRFWKALRNTAKNWTNFILPQHCTRIRELRDFDPTRSIASDILAHLERVLHTTADCWAWTILTGLMAKTSEKTFALLYNFRCNGLEIPYTTLLAGYPNKSIEADEAWLALCREACLGDSVRRIVLNYPAHEALHLLSSTCSTLVWYEMFSKWVSCYGHRVFELDLLHPTTVDNPTIALQAIRSCISKQNLLSPIKRLQEKAIQREGAKEALFRRARRMVFFGPLIRSALAFAQQYASIRENRPFFLHLGWPLMRQDILELGERLTFLGVLQNREDIFFLTADELKNAVFHLDRNNREEIETNGYLEKAVRRRQCHENYHLSRPPLNINPGLIGNLISRLRHRRSSLVGSTSLRGVPGSPGVVEGIVCVVRSPADFGKVSAGSILIAEYLTPAWTPLLSLVSGVVTEYGGALSHAAIVCREYEIPAVVGVSKLLDRIHDGELINIDGSTGIVRKKKGSNNELVSA